MNATPAPPHKPSFWRALLLAVLVAGLNFALWQALNRPTQPPNWTGKVAGFAYDPYQRYQSPIKQIFPSVEEVEGDIKLLSQHTDRLRTYDVLNNPVIPSLAKKYGPAVVDEACSAALELGVCEYHFVRRYLERRTPAPLSLRQVDPLIRQLTLYRDLIEQRTEERQ